MPDTITELWANNQDYLDGKSLSQILTFTGDGKLKDGEPTSNEFRKLLGELPISKLEDYVNECLTTKFDDSGYALQDLVNELGKRLGFDVTYGLYRGKPKQIGYDGFWTSSDHDIIVEVKTTDAFSINLDIIADYRIKLINKAKTAHARSSILLIVGREDTGGLEAQIRGSKHAWDIRLISIDSLIRLITLKEDLLDRESTFKTICKVLKPMEFTRLDYLIDTIFITGQEAQAIEDENNMDPDTITGTLDRTPTEKPAPVKFNDKCAMVLENYFGVTLKKQTRTLYVNKEKHLGLTCAVSKLHVANENYWFAFHRHQKESLSRFEHAYVTFGCGDESTIFVFDFRKFIGYLEKMSTTENNSRMYWHVKIKPFGDRFFLLRSDSESIDITNNKVSI